MHLPSWRSWRHGYLAVALAIGATALLATVIVPLALAAGNDDRATAEALVAELDHDAVHKPLIEGTVEKARTALERGTRMRSAGDEAHARLADGLAREWAETARDLAKAADAEKQANDARRDALDAGAQLDRERTMLEEGVTRTGRLRAELKEAEREANDTHRTVDGTSEAPPRRGQHKGDDAGAPKKRGGGKEKKHGQAVSE